MATNNYGFSIFIFLVLINHAFSFSTLDVCSHTHYEDLCAHTMSKLGNPSNPVGITKFALMGAMEQSSKALELSHSLLHKSYGEDFVGAMEDCVHLMDITKDQLQTSLSILNHGALSLTPSESHMVRTLLSAVITNHDTCLDSIKEKTNYQQLSSIFALQNAMSKGIHISSNALAIFTYYHPLLPSDQYHSSPFSIVNNKGESFPSWVSSQDRRVLLNEEVKADLVVAKDGSGNFTTITEALNAAPNKTTTRFVILVKSGVYEEDALEVSKKKINIMIVGQGADTTIITGSRNVIDGATTFKSASLAVVGQGFMARDIAILNTAGPAKHQAVALRVGADQSVFYRCRIEAYQDTLYVHSLRQFFRDCRISGTVDFIFGNAAVVFQKCTIVPRKPGQGQKNAVTAQGRIDPNQNTGISIQGCVITGDPELVPVKDAFPTYLGRPWKEYSRTVVMQSYIGAEFQLAGWLAWDGSFALETLFYAEYMNTGPGSNTSQRVDWKGYRVLQSQTEAVAFTVKEFIQGDIWISSADVEFTDGFFQ